MSTAPYHIRGARFGLYAAQRCDRGHPNTESQPKAQPEEVYGKNLTMGLTAENLAEMYNISRQEQDEFALAARSWPTPPSKPAGLKKRSFRMK